MFRAASEVILAIKCKCEMIKNPKMTLMMKILSFQFLFLGNKEQIYMFLTDAFLIVIYYAATIQYVIRKNINF